MPSAFTGPIRLEHLNADWKQWKLLEDLVWEVETLGSGKFIIVPAGFITDGASVPRLLWWLLPTTGAYLRAAALHDFLYANLKAGTPHSEAPTKQNADRQFRIATQACGISFPLGWLMWAMARVFGKAS